MRHQVFGSKLGRNTPHRRAMFRNMVIALITHEQITTTIPKAKAIRPMIEKLITKAKHARLLREEGKSDLAPRRLAMRILGGNPILVDRDLQDFTRKQLRSDGYRVNKYHELQRGPRIITKLFEDLAERFSDREGGYTRIVKLGKHRKGDGGDLCVLMLIGPDEGGPQLSGQFSRRRDKANRRAEWASRLRKSRSGSPAALAEPEVAGDDAPVSEAVESADATTATVEDTSPEVTAEQAPETSPEAPTDEEKKV